MRSKIDAAIAAGNAMIYPYCFNVAVEYSSKNNNVKISAKLSYVLDEDESNDLEVVYCHASEFDIELLIDVMKGAMDHTHPESQMDNFSEDFDHIYKVIRNATTSEDNGDMVKLLQKAMEDLKNLQVNYNELEAENDELSSRCKSCELVEDCGS
jgi:hypothetical protein